MNTARAILFDSVFMGPDFRQDDAANRQALSRCWMPWTSSLAFSKFIGRPNR
jgi:hypothetical protein